MKHLLSVILFFLIFSLKINAQGFSSLRSSYRTPISKSSELSLFLGKSYYLGDLNPGGHFKQMGTAYGVAFRRNLNGRWAYRFNLFRGKVNGSDSKATDPFQLQRNLSFTSNITELSLIYEFNFFPYNPYDNKVYFTPYAFVGLGVFQFSSKIYSSNQESSQQIPKGVSEGKKYKTIQPSIPLGAGIKFKPIQRVSIAIEWGMRRTFTDNIDDVSKTFSNGYQRGNSQTKDWYNYTGILLSYRIGKKHNTCAAWDKNK